MVGAVLPDIRVSFVKEKNRVGESGMTVNIIYAMKVILMKINSMDLDI
jgi:hypothetical protein